MKYVLVSGAVGGIGKTVISFLLENGFGIYALDLSEKVLSSFNHEDYYPFVCDITDVNALDEVAKVIKARGNEVIACINLAGVVFLGSVVEENVEKMRKIFDVNVLGMYNVNKMIFPFLKETKGRYINISSEYGILDAVPFHSFYVMSKHALEIYSDTLRREVHKFGIKVINIRPGAFKTNMQSGIQKQFDELLTHTENYRESLLTMENFMVKELNKSIEPSLIIKPIKKALFNKHPRYAYNVHNSLKMKTISLLPDHIQDVIYSKFFK